MLLSVQNDREWRRLAEQVLERPELGTDPAYATNAARVAHRERTDAAVAKAPAGLDPDAAVARLEAAGIACARLRDVPDVAAHPQLAARGRWREVESPVGPLRALLPPSPNSRLRSNRGTPIHAGRGRGTDGAVPALGEHTEALLRAVGMTDEEIAALRRDGVAA